MSAVEYTILGLLLAGLLWLHHENRKRIQALEARVRAQAKALKGRPRSSGRPTYNVPGQIQ